MMSYVVFKLQKCWFPDRLYSRPLWKAFGSDVAENAMSITVVNDSIYRATVDHCMTDFTAPVIEVKSDVKMEDDENDMEYPEISVKVSDYAFHIL